MKQESEYDPLQVIADRSPPNITLQEGSKDGMCIFMQAYWPDGSIILEIERLEVTVKVHRQNSWKSQLWINQVLHTAVGHLDSHVWLPKYTQVVFLLHSIATL